MKKDRHERTAIRKVRKRRRRQPARAHHFARRATGRFAQNGNAAHLRDPWFVAYETIADFRDSSDADIVNDIAVYCSKSFERPEAVKDAIGKILYLGREAKIVLYTDARENPRDDRIAAIVHQPNEPVLALTIDRLLQPEAA